MEEDRKQDESKQETPEAVKDTESGAVDAAAAETVAEKLPEKTEAEKVAEELEAEPGEAEAMPEDLMGMYEESFKQFEEGEVVQGRIISVDRDFVLVDIGYKSEGMIPRHEFQSKEGKLSVKSGDEVDVFLESLEDQDGLVVLTVMRRRVARAGRRFALAGATPDVALLLEGARVSALYRSHPSVGDALGVIRPA